jgi:Family of unknown function (DUF6090)
MKIFRNIRQKLAAENNVAKYLRYAVGEIILVVIGILVALQINNWNEERKNHIEEIALLNQLKSEFQSNLEQLDQKISIRKSMISASFKLLYYKDHPEARNKDSVMTQILPTLLSPTFDPVADNISGSNRILLLRNNKLKEMLSRWTTDIIQVTEEEVSWKSYSDNYYRPTLLKYSSFRTLINQFWKNNILQSFELDKNPTVKFDIKNSDRNSDVSKLLDSPTFEDHMANCASYSKLTNIQSESLRKRIVEILNLIDQELKN